MNRIHPLLISCIDGAPMQPEQNYYVPIVVEPRPNGERAYDIYSRMLEERIVMLNTPIDPGVASIITTQLLYLESVDPKKPIQLYISSPGGYVTACWDIHDVMRKVECPVITICKGLAASAAAVLLAAGDRRYVMPNAEVMIHQPLGGASGQASDVEIAAEHMKRTKRRLNELLAQYTGKTVEEIEKACDRDNYMTAAEAVAFGLADEVIQFPDKPLPGHDPATRPEPSAK